MIEGLLYKQLLPTAEPNHAWGSDWWIYGKQCLGAPAGPGDQQGQISPCLVLEQSYTHTQCVCARCPGMLLLGILQAKPSHSRPSLEFPPELQLQLKLCQNITSDQTLTLDFDKSQNLKLWTKLTTQIVTKLSYSKTQTYDKKLDRWLRIIGVYF